MDTSSLDKFTIEVEANEVICREGDLSKDLFIIISGKLMACARHNSRVTPLAYLTDGDYFGEFSFFDNQVRSADVISLKKTVLLQIPQGEMKKQFPKWLIFLARSLTSKLRTYNKVISERGIKKTNVKTLKPLSIEDQRKFYALITSDKL